MTGAVLDGLEASGPLADEFAHRLGSLRDALGKGFLDRTTVLELANRVSAEVAAFAKSYPDLHTEIERIAIRVTELRHQGFRSETVDATLSAAREALGRGDWDTVVERLAAIAGEIARVRSEQGRICRGIAEVDFRANLLQGFRLPMLPGVQALVVRAQDEARCWKLAEAREDLEMAQALMTQATRTGS